MRCILVAFGLCCTLLAAPIAAPARVHRLAPALSPQGMGTEHVLEKERLLSPLTDSAHTYRREGSWIGFAVGGAIGTAVVTSGGYSDEDFVLGTTILIGTTYLGRFIGGRFKKKARAAAEPLEAE